MTFFADLKAQIADYANRQDWSDALVTGFVRQAEQKFNPELRVDRMIQFDQSLVVSRCVPLPDDWLQMELVRIANPNVPDGYIPIATRAETNFTRPKTAGWLASTPFRGGRFHLAARPTRSTAITSRSHTTARFRSFRDQTTSWIYTKYPSLYLSPSLMHADMHAVGEEDKAAMMKQLVEEMINKLNAAACGARRRAARG